MTSYAALGGFDRRKVESLIPELSMDLVPENRRILDQQVQQISKPGLWFVKDKNPRYVFAHEDYSLGIIPKGYSNVEFFNCTFGTLMWSHKGVRITNGSIEALNISGVTTYDEHISGVSIITLSIQGVKVSGKSLTSVLKANTVLRLQLANASTVLQNGLYYLRCNELKIEYCNIANEIWLLPASVKKMKDGSEERIDMLRKVEILKPNISANATLHFQGHLSLQTLHIKDASLSLNSTIELTNLKCESLSITNLRSKGSMAFDSVEVSKNLVLDNTRMGYWMMEACDFTQCRIAVNRVQAEDVWYNGMEFPYELSCYQIIDRKNYWQVMAFAGLMEHAAKRIGDIAGAMRWHTLVLHAHNRYLGRKLRSEDKWNLAISEEISNHGQSWGRPLIWLFLLGALFYEIQLLITFDLNYDLVSTGYIIENYFESLLPTRDYNYLSLCEGWVESSWAYRFVDLLSRGVQAFIIYHFIRASRKFV